MKCGNVVCFVSVVAFCVGVISGQSCGPLVPLESLEGEAGCPAVAVYQLQFNHNTTRLCDQIVPANGTLYYSVVLTSSNAELEDGQFALEVTPKNASSVGMLMTVLVALGRCPAAECEGSFFARGECGYDQKAASEDATGAARPYVFLYRNAQEGLYYVTVTGNGEAINFDIELTKGESGVSRYVPLIVIPIVVTVFAMAIVVVYLVRRNRPILEDEELELSVREPAVGPKAKLGNHKSSGMDSLLRSSIGPHGNERTQSVHNLVELFKAQTAAIVAVASDMSDADSSRPVSRRERHSSVDEEFETNEAMSSPIKVNRKASERMEPVNATKDEILESSE